MLFALPFSCLRTKLQTIPNNVSYILRFVWPFPPVCPHDAVSVRTLGWKRLDVASRMPGRDIWDKGPSVWLVVGALILYAEVLYVGMFWGCFGSLDALSYAGRQGYSSPKSNN